MSDMTSEEIKGKMQTLIEPISEAIKNCTSLEEILMLASIMITTAAEIFENSLGKEGAAELINGLVKKDNPQ